MDIIRYVEERDFDQIYELELYLNNYCAKINPELFTKKNKIEESEENGKVNCFVIDHDSEIIGFFEAYIIATFDENGNACNKRYIVESFVIKEEYQNKNYGKKLFLFLEDQARKRGCEKIELTALNEKRTKHFYKKMGMDLEYYNMGKRIEYIQQANNHNYYKWAKERLILRKEEGFS